MTTEPEAYPNTPGRRQPATGKQLLGATWSLLRQDRELLWLPFIGALAGIVAAMICFAPGYGIGWLVGGMENSEFAAWVGLAFSLFGATLVGVFFQAALVIGANERAEGGDPTWSSVLREAWHRRGHIISWALFSTTVGLILRFLQDRLGVAGALLGALGGLAWTVATFLVVPVLVAEDVGPISALKRSAGVLRDTFGTSIRTTVRFGIIALLVWLPVVALFGLGVYVLSQEPGSTGTPIGVVLIVVAVVAMIVLATVFSAVLSYAKALIYRYAVGRPTPGIDPNLFAGAFTARRRGFA